MVIELERIWIISNKNCNTLGRATGEFKANIEGNFVKPFQQVRALSKQVHGQEKTPAFWEEKAGVTVFSNNKGGVTPDSIVHNRWDIFYRNWINL